MQQELQLALEEEDIEVKPDVIPLLLGLVSQHGVEYQDLAERLLIYKLNNNLSEITKECIPRFETQIRPKHRMPSSSKKRRGNANMFAKNTFNAPYSNSNRIPPVTPSPIPAKTRQRVAVSTSKIRRTKDKTDGFENIWGAEMATPLAKKTPMSRMSNLMTPNVFHSPVPGILPSPASITKSYRDRKDIGKTEVTFNEHLSLVDTNRRPDSDRYSYVQVDAFDTWDDFQENPFSKFKYRFMYEDVMSKTRELKQTVASLGGDLAKRINDEFFNNPKTSHCIDEEKDVEMIDKEDIAMKEKGMHDTVIERGALTQSGLPMHLMPNDEEEEEKEAQRQEEEKDVVMSSSGELNASNSQDATMVKKQPKKLVFEPVDTPLQSEGYFLGRIVNEVEFTRMKTQGVLLEGDWDVSNGRRVHVDLSQMEDYMLFPGQVVVIRGTNTSGKEILASQIFSNASVPKYMSDPSSNCRFMDLLPFQHTALQVMVAAGPFTTRTSLSYEGSAIFDFAKAVARRKPDVVILIGPFTDRENTLIKSNELACTFQELFEELLLSFVAQLRRTNTQSYVLVVPSPVDVHHVSAFPQPRYYTNRDMDPKVLFLSNPCQFRINQITFGVSSADALFHCGSNVVAKGSRVKSNRLKAIAENCIHQQSFYPLEPAHESIRMDFTHKKHLHFIHTPDILILPSMYRYFAQVLDENVLCVNPAKLTKVNSGGTYGLITIHAPSENDIEAFGDSLDITKHIRADIIRI